MALGSWPTITDDDGTFLVGTVIDKSVFDAILASIEADLFSAANPSVTCENIIDEVVDARGSKSDLDARLDIALNEDGTLKTQSGLVTAAEAAELPQTNVVLNDTFIIWDAGDSAAATGWTLAGTGAACARDGTGVGDTKRKVGDFCSKLTFGSSTLTYYQEFLPAAAYSRLDHLDGEDVSLGAWVWTATASKSRLYVADGADTTYSSYHTGGSGWEWLSLTHTINASATYLRAGISVEEGITYFSGPTVIFGSVAPTNWRPTPNMESVLAFDSLGNIAVLVDRHRYVFGRMAILKNVQIYFKTAPAGSDFIIDLNNGGATLCTTKPTVDDGDSGGEQDIDGTYEHRCFAGESADAPSQLLTVDIDQIGSGTAGADMTIMVRFLEFIDPFESVKAA